MGTGGDQGEGPPLSADLQVRPCLPQWKQNKTTLLENSQRVTTALLARSEISMGDRQVPPSAATMNSRCFQQLDEGYDEEYGGFAEAPKFPTPGPCPLHACPTHIPALRRLSGPSFLTPSWVINCLLSRLATELLPLHACQWLSREDLICGLSGNPMALTCVTLFCSPC